MARKTINLTGTKLPSNRIPREYSIMDQVRVGTTLRCHLGVATVTDIAGPKDSQAMTVKVPSCNGAGFATAKIYPLHILEIIK